MTKIWRDNKKTKNVTKTNKKRLTNKKRCATLYSPKRNFWYGEESNGFDRKRVGRVRYADGRNRARRIRRVMQGTIHNPPESQNKNYVERNLYL